jgi:hypothetical protein
MKNLLILMILISLIAGCMTNQISNRKNFEFKNTNDSVLNDQKCLELCKDREGETGYYDGNPARYTCDYEPVICEGDKCLCKTF